MNKKLYFLLFRVVMSYSSRVEHYHKKYRYYKKYYLELSARQKGGLDRLRKHLGLHLTGTDKYKIGDLKKIQELAQKIKKLEIKVLKLELQTQSSGNKGVVLTNLSESIDTIVKAINSDKTAIQDIKLPEQDNNAIETLHQEVDTFKEIIDSLNLSIGEQSGYEAENIEQIKAAVASLKASTITGTGVLKIVAKVSNRSLDKAEQEAVKTKELTQKELQSVAEILTLYGELKRFDDSLRDIQARATAGTTPATQP